MQKAKISKFTTLASNHMQTFLQKSVNPIHTSRYVCNFVRFRLLKTPDNQKMSNRIKLHAQAVSMHLHNAHIKITANQTDVVDGSCGQKCHSGSELAEVWV